MKTLGAWIAGIFALGLLLGSFVSGSGAVAELSGSDLESALEVAPLVGHVDCGDGREALLEPVQLDGETTFKVRCVPMEQDVELARVVAKPSPPISHVEAPANPGPSAELPTRVSSAPEVSPSVSDPNDAAEEEGRTWKESAVVIGGAAGAGAGIGAIAKGKKGAAVGAAIGAASGTAYELIKRDKKK